MVATDSTAWKSYEEVAQHLLNEFADRFRLGRVEGKQIVPGASGTDWKIDAKGVCEQGDGFVIIECKRYTTQGLCQEIVGGLAYRVVDTGAKGGIVVSPLELQTGARKVAGHSNIIHVKLDPKSTTTDYVMRFLNQVFVGLTAKVEVTGSLEMKVIKGGKIVEIRKVE
ncbi:hypothetical protein KAX17_05750 [Candidatus Bipolaricaulota bacterium]|nr:hypothetical protein [Candidatus Bipolaricaulota bacterium]